MERTKTVAPIVDGRIRWKQTGGGTLRLKVNGTLRIIKPGEVFRALPSEVPLAFRDTIIPLDGTQKVEEEKIVVSKVTYEVKPRGKSKSLFDVVDRQGKRMNEAPLSKVVADQFKKDLEK